MKIGFIGCGNMGSAMISGMLKKGLYKKDGDHCFQSYRRGK